MDYQKIEATLKKHTIRKDTGDKFEGESYDMITVHSICLMQGNDSIIIQGTENRDHMEILLYDLNNKIRNTQVKISALRRMEL